MGTYGTAKDCLDDDLESELNAMAAKKLMDSSFLSNDPMANPSVSAGLTPNRSRQFTANEFMASEQDHSEQSEALSLESISNSEDEESPPLRSIQINKANSSVNVGAFGRGRRGSTTLQQPVDQKEKSGTDRLWVIEEDDSSSSSEDDKHLDIRVKMEDDVSCDDMMT